MQKFVSLFTTESMHRCAPKSWPEESSTEDILALRRLSSRGGRGRGVAGGGVGDGAVGGGEVGGGIDGCEQPRPSGHTIVKQ